MCDQSVATPFGSTVQNSVPMLMLNLPMYL